MAFGPGGTEVLLPDAWPAASQLAAQWPPAGIEVLDAFQLPLLNTFLLLLSGTTITWAHHALIHGQRGGRRVGLWGLLGVGEDDGVKKGLWLTIVLGLLFSCIQASTSDFWMP